jgi:hypothetical protein
VVIVFWILITVAAVLGVGYVALQAAARMDRRDGGDR